MRASWQIGSLFGIPLYIDSSWLLILVFITLVNATDVESAGLSENHPFLGWLTGLMAAFLLFGSVLFHELGHSLVARSQGIKVNSITLFLFGGLASIERESQTPAGAFWVAIAGPMVSLMLFGVFFLLSEFWQASPLIEYLTTDLARINLVLAIFNLIPGLPLDGGQILKAIVWKITGDRFRGVHWASVSGQFMGWLGIILGLFIFLLTGEIGGAWIGLIGWFVLRNAAAYNRLTLIQKSLLKIVAADVMTREFRVIDAHLTLQAFTQEYLLSPNNINTVYYAASEGRYRGLVESKDLNLIERSQWNERTLLDIAHSLIEIPSVQEKTPLVDVIAFLEQSHDLKITVLSPAGAVAGVIDRGDIVKAVANQHNFLIPEIEIKRIKSEGTYPAYLQLAAIAKTLAISNIETASSK